MKYEIIYDELSKNDLIEHIDYIERMTFSKDKAELYILEIISSIGVLSLFPYMYQIFYKEFYSINIKNKRIIYFIDDNNKKVIIFRILGQNQEYKNIL